MQRTLSWMGVHSVGRHACTYASATRGLVALQTSGSGRTDMPCIHVCTLPAKGRGRSTAWAGTPSQHARKGSGTTVSQGPLNLHACMHVRSQRLPNRPILGLWPRHLLLTETRGEQRVRVHRSGPNSSNSWKGGPKRYKTGVLKAKICAPKESKRRMRTLRTMPQNTVVEEVC